MIKLNVGQKLKVLKDIYYVSDGKLIDNEFLSKEEVFNSMAHVLVKDDVYEVIEEDNKILLLCIEGTWKDETNDGWFDVNNMLSKDVFEILN